LKSTLENNEAFVRPYQTADRDALMHIAAETAFFGEPVERFLEDRRIFQDAFYAYYTDYEPEHTWIAVRFDDGQEQVVGFLTGCFNSAHQERILQQHILPGVIQKRMLGQYRLGKRTLQHVWRMALGSLRREYPKVDEKRYPAHLHINLLPRSRGMGLGYALMQAYLNQLKAHQISGVHLQTTSLNTAAIRLYERCGFVLLDARPTRAWEGLVGGLVKNLSYGMELE
jgi:ribosomal protein S18 acetylase RimI-like enzyme